MEERLAALEAGAPASPDEGIEWPDAADESAFLSEARSRGETPVPVAPLTAAPTDADVLPPLDELVARVPPAVLGMLDDLFRAKFTGVRRYAPADLPK